MQRRTAHLNALLQFSQELLGARGLDAVLQRALDHAMALVPEAHSAARSTSMTRATQRLALRASAGFSPLPDFSRPVDLGLIGRCLHQPPGAYLTHSAEEWLALARELGDDEPSGCCKHCISRRRPAAW